MGSAPASTALVVACLVLQGCWGPYYDPEQPTLPSISVREPVRGVVVSDFYQGQHQVSQTRSLDIVTLREAMTVRDVSLPIASVIQGQGIPARAMTGAGPTALEPGELLVRGVINFGGWDFHGVATKVQVVCTFATLCLYGILTPYLYPVELGPPVTVRVDIIDRAGNALLSNEERIHVYNRSFWFLGWLESDVPPAMDELRGRVGAVIARTVASARLGPGSSAAPLAVSGAAPPVGDDLAARVRAIERGRTTRADVRRAFGEPGQVTQVGAVERWTYIYPGAVGRALVVDFDAGGLVCDHAYSEQPASRPGRDIDASRVRDIRTGVTTKSDVRGWFGEPQSVTPMGPAERWTYIDVVEGRQPRVKALVVDFDAKGTVCDQGYTEQ